MRARSLLVASLLAALAVVPFAPGRASAALHPGDPAPDFRGTDLDGFSWHLTEFRGEVVILFVLGST